MSEKKSKLLALAAGSLVLGGMGAAQLDASALQDYSNLGRAAKLRSSLHQSDGELVMQDGQDGSCGAGSCGNGQCGSTSPHAGNCGSGWNNDDNGNGGGQASCGSGGCGQGTCGS